jgi:hypothetical protein
MNLIDEGKHSKVLQKCVYPYISKPYIAKPFSAFISFQKMVL